MLSFILDFPTGFGKKSHKFAQYIIIIFNMMLRTKSSMCVLEQYETKPWTSD